MGASILMVAANFLGIFDMEMDHDVDHDVDVDHDIDADHDVDGEHEHHGMPSLNLLSLLGIGRVPLSVLLMTWLMSFGMAGTTVNMASGPWLPGHGVISLFIAFAAAIVVGGVVARFVGKHIPSTETYTVSKADLIACDGVAATTITPSSGGADIQDDGGSRHRVSAVTVSGEIQRGTKVHVISYGGDNSYVVEQLPE
jgi:hypothetical protein